MIIWQIMRLQMKLKQKTIKTYMEEEEKKNNNNKHRLDNCCTTTIQ